MSLYVGTKIIKAEPMTLTQFNEENNKVIPATSGEEGYKVTYPDGYVSWSPRDVFNNAYRLITNEEKDLLR